LGVPLLPESGESKREVAGRTNEGLGATVEQVAAARLEALENDRAPLQEGGGDESDEYVVSSGVESGAWLRCSW
jgi:hypothetical protein